MDRKRCKSWNGRPRESRKRKWKTRVSRKEAAAEIEAGGRRKEIADEAIRRAECVEVERLKPLLDEEWR